jgi:hypothetical protein
VLRFVGKELCCGLERAEEGRAKTQSVELIFADVVSDLIGGINDIGRQRVGNLTDVFRRQLFTERFDGRLPDVSAALRLNPAKLSRVALSRD